MLLWVILVVLIFSRCVCSCSLFGLLVWVWLSFMFMMFRLLRKFLIIGLVEVD